jgi:hypothetical protein
MKKKKCLKIKYDKMNENGFGHVMTNYKQM